VTFELLGKARELAATTGEPVRALLLGHGVERAARELLHYGAEEVLVYDHPALKDFRIDAYAAAFEDCIHRSRPSTILVGATAVGRQLAPRVAARMRTGLTADCTVLQMRPDTDLVQIRPAFGGNIMAQILTPNHRPQMATVRYKVMDAPRRAAAATGKIVHREIADDKLASRVEVLETRRKPAEQAIDAADTLVVAGRGIKKESDLQVLRELAELLDGQLACTRPLVENGWVEARRQIGLSGRTVRPRLIVTCGVSGAIQFVAGMNHSETIVAINKDEKAGIFKAAHYGLVGDLYAIVPRLIESIKAIKAI
jgi:electron transfer flavoprotein alpha subunit